MSRAIVPWLAVLSLALGACQQISPPPLKTQGPDPAVAHPATPPAAQGQPAQAMPPPPSATPTLDPTAPPAEQSAALPMANAIPTLVPPVGSTATPAALPQPGAETVVIGGEATPPPAAVQNSAARIALLLPLSGSSAAIGEALLSSAQMALFDSGSQDVVLQIYDTRGTPDGAARAAETALAQGVRLILGPVFSADVKAVAPKARAVNVNVIAFSTDPSAAGDGVYIMGYLLRHQVQRVTQFARSRGLSTFAALAPSDEYGRAAVNALREAAAAAGGQVTAVEFYEPNAADLTPVVKRLSTHRPFDALLIPDKGSKVKMLAPLLPYFDIEPSQTRLIGTQRWAEGDFRGEPAMTGAWYSLPATPLQKQFADHFKQVYGVAPNPLASLAYDAVALAAALARGEAGPNFDTGALTTDIGFAGVDGIFRFRPDGMAERGLSVFEVAPDGTPQEVSPAPDSFDRTVY